MTVIGHSLRPFRLLPHSLESSHSHVAPPHIQFHTSTHSRRFPNPCLSLRNFLIRCIEEEEEEKIGFWKEGSHAVSRQGV